MFTVFKKILNPRSEITEEDVKKVSDFVFCRWLSGNPGTIQVAQIFNVYYDIPLELKIKVAQQIIAGRIKYIPYPKGAKAEEDKNVNAIMEYFKLSRQKALMYLEFISEEDLEYVVKAIESKDANR